MPTYTGGCHCGAVRFEVTAEIDEVGVCNCSICAKTGYLHCEVEPSQFRLLSPEPPLHDYQFGTMTAHNTFCTRCGISPYRRSRSSPDTIDINVRCLDGVDTAAIPVRHFDGQNWEEAFEKLKR